MNKITDYKLFILERIKIDELTLCWNWTRRVENNGYARAAKNRRSVYAHRLSYETFVGEIPTGLQIDHLCRNRKCVNPAHLEPVTGSVNVRRSPVHISALWRARKTCSKGHEWTGTKTTQSRTFRVCQTCDAEKHRLIREKKKNVI